MARDMAMARDMDKGYGQGKWTREMAARDVAKGYGQKKSSKANRNNNPVKEGNSTK